MKITKKMQNAEMRTARSQDRFNGFTQQILAVARAEGGKKQMLPLQRSLSCRATADDSFPGHPRRVGGNPSLSGLGKGCHKNGQSNEDVHRIHQDELAAFRIEAVEAADGPRQRK